mmetsp:Transcript_12353/g.40562  ORF Transcript_12353/g.40562 Transcript_12353/m.40562 type:complete len:526 (+) Transcript_12353:244-1821(+)
MRRQSARTFSQSRAALLCGSAVLLLLFGVNTTFFSSTWCDRRMQSVTDQKDREMREALEQLQQSLEQQTATLERLHAARAGSRGRIDRLKRASRSAREAVELQVASAGDAAMHDSVEADRQEQARSARRQAVTASDRQEAQQPALSSSLAVGAAALASVPFPNAASAGSLAPCRIAVVVIAYNRPRYLERSLSSVFSRHPGGDAFPVFVSQDGVNDDVTAVVRRHGARSLVHPRRAIDLKDAPAFLRKAPGYAYLSVHYGWALRTLFGAPQGYEGVIILEEDLEVAPDFFDYFNATAPLLYQDASLLAVSAFNDNGQPRYASDETVVHRSDFFPGLGWLLTRRLWDELDAKWPEEKGCWDDWMREPAQRRGRSSIRPETSRSRTFGEKGTSMSQFYSKFLAPIQFAPAPAVWQGRNLSFLMKEQYDAAFDAQLAAARLRSLTEARALGGGGGSGGSDSPVRISYSSAAELKRMSHELGIMEDLKAGVPRTGYRGVVHLRIGGTPVLLAPTFKVDQDITKPLSERP